MTSEKKLSKILEASKWDEEEKDDVALFDVEVLERVIMTWHRTEMLKLVPEEKVTPSKGYPDYYAEALDMEFNACRDELVRNIGLDK